MGESCLFKSFVTPNQHTVKLKKNKAKIPDYLTLAKMIDTIYWGIIMCRFQPLRARISKECLSNTSVQTFSQHTLVQDVYHDDKTSQLLGTFRLIALCHVLPTGLKKRYPNSNLIFMESRFSLVDTDTCRSTNVTSAHTCSCLTNSKSGHIFFLRVYVFSILLIT